MSLINDCIKCLKDQIVGGELAELVQGRYWPWELGNHVVLGNGPGQQGKAQWPESKKEREVV